MCSLKSHQALHKSLLLLCAMHYHHVIMSTAVPPSTLHWGTAAIMSTAAMPHALPTEQWEPRSPTLVLLLPLSWLFGCWCCCCQVLLTFCRVCLFAMCFDRRS